MAAAASCAVGPCRERGGARGGSSGGGGVPVLREGARGAGPPRLEKGEEKGCQVPASSRRLSPPPGTVRDVGPAKEEAPWAKRRACGWTGCSVWASPGLRWVRGVRFRDGATSLACSAMRTNVFQKILS